MYRILIEEMNKWADNSIKIELREMIETLTERLYDNCTSDIQKAELISIFTEAMEDS
tara:strand:- start:917 stop:1087 length:171 start_codon:yes stop_codon:yes gene_type:complete